MVGGVFREIRAEYLGVLSDEQSCPFHRGPGSRGVNGTDLQAEPHEVFALLQPQE